MRRVCACVCVVCVCVCVCVCMCVCVLQHMLDALDRACAQQGMQISVSKTKILTVEEQGKDRQVKDKPSITLRGQALEEVESFSYLGSEVGQSAKVEKEVAVRLEKAGKAYQNNVEEESLQEP